MTYHERVLAYEAQGMTTSDAQSVVDVEILKAANHCDCDVERNNITYVVDGNLEEGEKIHYCRLHLAAPALLAALKALHQANAETFEGLPNYDALWDAAAKAIAQAEGQEVSQ